jgi:hypothetical protein
MKTQLLHLLDRARLPKIGHHVSLRQGVVALKGEAQPELDKPYPHAIRYRFIAEFGTDIVVGSNEQPGALDVHTKHVRALVAHSVYAEIKAGLLGMFETLYQLRNETREANVLAISTELLDKIDGLMRSMEP